MVYMLVAKTLLGVLVCNNKKSLNRTVQAFF